MLPTVRSTAIRPEEDALRVALEEIEEDIKRPGGVGKMRGKLNELWALVGSINAARERGRKVGLDGTSDWTVVDEEGLKQISQVGFLRCILLALTSDMTRPCRFYPISKLVCST